MDEKKSRHVMSSSEILAFVRLSRPPQKDGRNGRQKKKMAGTKDRRWQERKTEKEKSLNT